MNLTDRLVEFCLSADFDAIPESVIKVQKSALIDAVSVMVCATRLEPSCRKIIDFAKRYSGDGRSTLFAAEAKLSAPMAALANGCLAHAMDFEDSHDTAFVHSNAVSIPALLAVAEEQGGVSGKALITSMVVASEITCRLSMAVKEDLLPYGWYMPPVHGAMGAVFGVAKMMGLKREQLLDAIAILMNTYTCSGEVVNSRVSVIRLVRDGFAAKAAVEACLMAREGVKARFDTPLEGTKGFYAAYAGNRYFPERVTEGLGSVWESGNISFKPWPCCRATHATIGALMDLMKKPGVSRESIAGIHLRVSEIMRMVLEESEIKYHPQSVMNAKMSIPFAVGLLLADGEITLSSFSQERLSDEAVLAGGSLVTYEYDPELDRDNAQKVIMTITLKDGTVYTRTVEHALGSIEHPMAEKDIYKKYRDCMNWSQKEKVAKNVDLIYRNLKEIEQCETVEEIMKLM